MQCAQGLLFESLAEFRRLQAAKSSDIRFWGSFAAPKTHLSPQVCPQGARSRAATPSLERAKPFSTIYTARVTLPERRQRVHT